MSFWNTSSGENVAENATTEYEIGGDIELIPDGSTVRAYIKDVAWARNDRGAMEEYINIQWKVEAPESLEGRVVFQKLWVSDLEPNALKKGEDAAKKKRDKALRALSTIDANAGGKLAKKTSRPNDDELMLAFANKSMAITVKIWEMDAAEGGKRSGNWIAAIHPKDAELKVGKVLPSAAKATAKSDSGVNYDDLDDDIPF